MERDRMANRCLILITLLSVTVTIGIVCLMTVPAMAQEEQWNKTFGGTGDDYGYSIQQTTDGGYVIAGYTYSYGAGDADVWLIKTDSNGTEQWNRTFGGAEADLLDRGSVRQTSDGGYIITGYTYSYGADNGSVWLIKTDQNGNEMWNRTFGGEGLDWGHSVQQTFDGGYIIAGRTHPYAGARADVWLIKTNSTGVEEWNRRFGTDACEYATSLQQTTDGGYIITGRTTSYDAAEVDVLLIKTDTDGIEEWNRTFGGPYYDYGYSVQQTSDGGYIIAGSANGRQDIWLIKTDSNGVEQWNRTLGGSAMDEGYSVQQTADGGYIVAGYTESYGAGLSDVWLIKTDSNGIEQWNKTFGGAGCDTGRSVQQTADSGYIVAGFTNSYGGGYADVWLIKSSTSAPKPDLITTMITPLSFFPNQPNTITGTLANTGSADAGSFNVSLSVDGAVVDTTGVASLCAGGTVDANFTWTPAVGDYELCVFADCDFAINESDEDNNELCEDVTVHVNTVYFMPISSRVVEVRVNTTDAIDHILTDISFDPACINITDVEFGPGFTLADWMHKGDHISVDGFDFGPSCTQWNDRLLANLTVHCKDCYCISQLSFTGLENVTKLIECGGKARYGANWIGGSVRCTVKDITPPASITNLTNITGNFWINWTWTNPADADFNYTMVYIDGAWETNTSIEYFNLTNLSPHATKIISTHTVDTSGNINETWVNQTTTIPNNGPVLEGIGDKTVDEGQTVTIAVNATDLDGDTLAYSCNRTDLLADFNRTTGIGSWTPSSGQAGTYYVNFGVSDGYGGVDNETIKITVLDKTPPASISNLGYANGTTWINWSWNNPQDLDFNYTMVYLNGTWQTNTSYPFYNATDLYPDTCYEIGTHTVDTSVNINETWVNQTAKTQAEISEKLVFDTGEGTYPSIFGTHKGKIVPDKDIMVSKIYTYPCEGTGGHSEYVTFYYQNGTEIGNASWEGYAGDWHNVSFDHPIILSGNETYEYLIKTGSYPQIIHKPKLETEEGEITCLQFEDANGKIYHDWIPAIKLLGAKISPVRLGGNIVE